jgi:hypothetical protein
MTAAELLARCRALGIEPAARCSFARFIRHPFMASPVNPRRTP